MEETLAGRDIWYFSYDVVAEFSIVPLLFEPSMR